MNLSDINPNLPCLRPLTSSQRQSRRLSCSTNTKSTYSSSSNQSKQAQSLPILIQLCIYPNEDYSLETMKLLFSSRQNYSANVYDEFACNLLMYTLRYQRLQLFSYLLNEMALDLNLRSKDRQGNTILHYAIIYGKDQPQILEKLVERFNTFAIDVDQRNVLGFTPLLLAGFCGRYDLVLSLLKQTDASPFVRDYLHSKNLMDYLEDDIKSRESLRKVHNTSRSTSLTRESTRLHLQLYQALPPPSESSVHTIYHHPYKNFFEQILPQVVRDRSGSLRSSLLKTFHPEDLATDLSRLVQYIHYRYPRTKTPKKRDHSQDMTSTITTTTTITQLVHGRENSKSNVHHIFSLFDPHLRPKASAPKPNVTIENVKTPITFKRLGAKLTVLAALSRSSPPSRPTSSAPMIDTK